MACATAWAPRGFLDPAGAQRGQRFPNFVTCPATESGSGNHVTNKIVGKGFFHGEGDASRNCQP